MRYSQAVFKASKSVNQNLQSVVINKTGEKIEWKKRTGETSELLSMQEIIKRLNQKIIKQAFDKKTIQ